MINKKLKPTSPGTRHQIVVGKNLLCKNKNGFKCLIIRVRNTGGRSTKNGRTTVWSRGGGGKKKVVKKNQLGINTAAICVAVVYNTKQNAFIAIQFNFSTLTFNCTIHSFNQTIGSVIESGLNNNRTNQRYGSRHRIEDMFAGSIINSVGFRNKLTYGTSAGSYCQVVQKKKNLIKLKLPSGKIIACKPSSYGTLGSVSNQYYSSCVLGKAGKNRKKGNRSIVRGVAMNPIDHPHGGRTKGGRPSVTPWGKLTKGVRTVKKKYI